MVGAFSRVRSSLQVDDNHFTAINHGLSLLQAGKDQEFDNLLGSVTDGDASQALTLERALVLASKRDLKAAPLLDHFLRQYPDAKRTVEARLAFVEISLVVDLPDLSMIAV